MKMQPTGLSTLGMILLLWALEANSALVTVNMSTDEFDIDWQTATVDDLPGPDGRVSLTEAMIATNNTAGRDTIGFAVPQAEWLYQWLYPGRAVIWTSYSFFWGATDEVVFDCRTQTAYTGDTNPDGGEVTFFGGQMYFNVGNCALYGLDGTQVGFIGDNHHIAENTGGIGIQLYGSTNCLIERNSASTIKLDHSHNNFIVGNTCQRIRIWGAGLANLSIGNRIGGPELSDRNFITGYGSITSDGSPGGTDIELFDTDSTIIENNWIGTTPDGLAQGHQYSTAGIFFDNINRRTIVRNNIISGILGHGENHYAGQVFGNGITISGNAVNIRIEDNVIGPDANGDAVLGSVTGITVGTYNYIAMDSVVLARNVIAGHRFNGITVGPSVPASRFSQNSMFSNFSLGIDLMTPGFAFGGTPNDVLDGDLGGNRLQNFPVMTAASAGSSTASLTGTFNSYPNSAFTLEFFASPSCHANGYGEGKQYLGSTSVTTNGSGDAAFDVVLSAAVSAGWVATATATREPMGATSEFSTCLPITVSNCTEVPGNLTIAVYNNAAYLQWQPTNTALTYEVFAATESNGTYVSLGTTSGLTNFVDNSFQDFSQRYYYVVAICE